MSNVEELMTKLADDHGVDSIDMVRLAEAMKEAAKIQGYMDDLGKRYPIAKKALFAIMGNVGNDPTSKEAMITGAATSLISVMAHDTEELRKEVTQLTTVVNNLASLVADK